jgi:hypothetical protein
MYNSYRDYLDSSSSSMNKEEGIRWFEDLEMFIYCHDLALKKKISYSMIH